MSPSLTISCESPPLTAPESQCNTVLLRSIFQMGVPVSGKNLFPSNIARRGTPVRASGGVAPHKEIDFLVAIGSETAKEDVLSHQRAGATALPLKLNELRRRPDLYASLRQG